MVNWLQKFKASSKQTKYFALTWLVYGLAIVASTIYCYARIDFVRSGIPLKRVHEDTRK